MTIQPQEPRWFTAAPPLPHTREQPRRLVPKSASEATQGPQGRHPAAAAFAPVAQPVRGVHELPHVAVVLVVVVGGLGFFLGKQAFDGPARWNRRRPCLIRPNTGVAEIASILERRGMISDARLFRLGLRAYGHDASLRAGEYEITAGASMHEIMELLRSGRSVQHALTIPEGFTVHQALERIANMEELEGDMPDELPPEGSLAADTLRFTRGMDRRELIQRLMNDQKRLVESIWERRVDGLPINDIKRIRHAGFHR